MSVIDKLSNIAWAATVKLALARGISSGLVFAVVGSLADPSFEPIPIFFGWAIFSLAFVGIFQLMAMMRFPGAGIASFLLSLLIVAGDPIVYVFNRIFPAILNVADFKILNFNALMLVHHPE